MNLTFKFNIQSLDVPLLVEVSVVHQSAGKDIAPPAPPGAEMLHLHTSRLPQC